ncbi:unnamed protein product [Nippostrongylus brasiliensis]|uniref:Guanylate cyclase n=1 Tax=Nippostrongylus brasiliensis TaxID=27835 RepID=A0A0N4Y0A5_NIPBR|nr:unnamed protein product [Nippostrongylus brasiliensis]
MTKSAINVGSNILAMLHAANWNQDLRLSIFPDASVNLRAAVDASLKRLRRLKDQLCYRTPREGHPQTSVSVRTLLPPIPFPRTQYKQPEANTEIDGKMRVLSAGILRALDHHSRLRRNNLTCQQRQGLRELRDLTSSGGIRVSVSDKGGEFVVISQSLDREITHCHLRDESVYRPSTAAEFSLQHKRLNDIWMAIGKSAGLDRRLVQRLRVDNPICPVFYSLVKTHKLPLGDLTTMPADAFKIRPIISCIGGPTDRISWFLSTIVSQLLPVIPSHLSNTKMFLELLHNTRFETSCVIESFDVTSLYTNVQNEQALQALAEMMELHENNIVTFGLSKAQVVTLVKECLKCNIFRWSGNYYSQIRGLAMGQRLAPVLAICFMSRIEEPVLARRPLLYCRYVDDCFVVTSTQSEMDECFRIMNEQSQHIKLTREVPKNGWLPFLNTQVKASKGVFDVKWYRKESCKNILIHATSAHPMTTKRAIIRSMFRTAVSVCTSDVARQESIRTASVIAKQNGYPIAVVSCRDCYASNTELDLRTAAAHSHFRAINVTGYLFDKGITILSTVEISKNWSAATLAESVQLLTQICRVIILLLGPQMSDYTAFMTAMNTTGNLNVEYSLVVVLLDYQATERVFPWTSDPALLPLFNRTYVLINDAFDTARVDAFLSKHNFGSNVRRDIMQVLELYESLHVFAYTLRLAYKTDTSGNYNATTLRPLMKTVPDGPFGEIFFNEYTQRLAPFSFGYVSDTGYSLVTKLEIDHSNSDALGLFLNLSNVNFIIREDTPTCGFSGELCDQTGDRHPACWSELTVTKARISRCGIKLSRRTHQKTRWKMIFHEAACGLAAAASPTIFVIFIMMAAVALCIGMFVSFRKIKHIESMQMPWAIPFSSLKFIDLDISTHGSQQLSILSLNEHMETKVKMRDFLRTRQLATINQSYVLVETIALKERLVFFKQDLKHSSHENINPFIGISYDSTRLYVLWTHCFRGSLAEQIFGRKDERATFENNFRGAFVRDILKGLDYIHNSPIGYHGALTAGHCLIDSHWILKISGFGLSRMLFRMKNAGVIGTEDGHPFIPNSDLHYFAPEIRAELRSHMFSNKFEGIHLTNAIGKAADMWSFGTILFEILFRRKYIEVDEYQECDDDVLICEKTDDILQANPPVVPEDREIHADLHGLIQKCWDNVDNRPDISRARKITDATLKM